jgi:hypothetical protein
MKKISDIISKPSEALQAMVDGLIASKTWENFELDMSTYGNHKLGEVCFGCAATCTVYAIAKKQPNNNNIYSVGTRSIALDLERSDLFLFEHLIDSARRGLIKPLFHYFQMGWSHENYYDRRFDLNEINWEKKLPEVKKLIAELKTKEV